MTVPASRLIAVCVVPALVAASLPASAASVSLFPSANYAPLEAGELVQFEVRVDFSDAGGTLGGGFDVVFDANALALVNLVDSGVGDPGLSREPDRLPGRLESWAIGVFNGIPGTEVLGTLTFQVLPGMMNSTLIELTATEGVGGPWVALDDFVTILQPEYNHIQLTSVKILADGFEASTAD